MKPRPETKSDTGCSLERMVRRRSRNMTKLSERRWVRRYLCRWERLLCPPMAQNGFNEWNYWHLVGPADGGIVPTSPELLILHAWRLRKWQRLKPPNDPSSATAATRRVDLEQERDAAVRCSAWLGAAVF